MKENSSASLYRRHVAPGLVAMIHRDWEDCFPNPTEAIEEVIRHRGQIVRGGDDEGFTARCEIRGRSLFAKVYLRCRLSRKLRNLIGDYRAIREWRCHMAAADAGVDASTVVIALTERRSFTFRHLVATAPVGGIAVSDILDEKIPSPIGIDDMVERLGRQIAHYHQLGFFHRHLRATHFFLQEDLSLRCIDLEASRVQLPLPDRLRQENLQQIKKTLERYPLTKLRYPDLEAAYQHALRTRPASPMLT